MNSTWHLKAEEKGMGVGQMGWRGLTMTARLQGIWWLQAAEPLKVTDIASTCFVKQVQQLTYPLS